MTDSIQVAQTSASTSGLSINLHPLPILNISDHQTRTRLTSNSPPKIIGALLGSRENRQISVINSFELVLLTGQDGNEQASYPIDGEFFETRKAQYEEVFPSLTVVGWYTVGSQPTAEDLTLQKKMAGLVESPICLVFGTDESGGLPLKVYEAAVGADDSTAKFAELAYGIETGEAERIAVDGVSRGTDDDSAVVSNLTTQRNAIRMLHERIVVLLQYVMAIINKQTAPDHSILRQISSIVAGLPTMDAPQFEEELATEYSDVQLTEYLTTLTKQLSALNDYADKHSAVFPEGGLDTGHGGPQFLKGGFSGGRGGGGGGGSGGRTRRNR